MKIGIPATATDLDSKMEDRFGRAKAFLIYDTESGTGELLDNTENTEAAQGAGVQAAGSLANTGIEAVICPQLGPKAFQVLKGQNIRIYYTQAETLRQAIARLEAGELEEQNAPKG